MPRLAGVAIALATFASTASASALPPIYDAWAGDTVASNVDPSVDDANRVRSATESHRCRDEARIVFFRADFRPRSVIA